MENINERYRLIESFGQLVEQLVEDEINLVIPEYQRSYSWDRSNAEILLNDLKNCKGNYFLGLYLLDWQSSIRSFSIVDGQQRLTTLFLLLAVLKNREDFQNFRESSFEKFLYPSSQFESSTRLSLQESDKALFRKLILGQRNVGNAGGDRYDSQRRLREVFCYFKDKCQSLSVTECEKIVKTISSAKVLIHVEQNVGMAMRVFELLNDRGKRLTDIEVVKSYSMSLAWNLARDESDRKKFTNDVKDVFSEIYRTLKEINSYKKGYSGDEVLRYHVIAFSDWKDKVDYTNARETFKNILNGHGTMSSLQRELDSLAQTYSDLLEIYRGVYENKDKNKIFRWVKNVYVLNRMASSIPLLLSIKKIYPDDDEFFDLVCNYLELFCYRAFDVRGLRSDAGASVLYVMAKDINHHDPKYSDKRKILTGLARLIVKYCSFDDNVFLEYLRDPNFYVSRGGSEERYLFVKYENSLVLECRRETKGTEKKFISDVKKIMNEGEDFFPSSMLFLKKKQRRGTTES